MTANIPTISLTLLAPGAHIAVIKPTGFLGRSLFETFREAIDGARFDGTTRTNRAPLDKVPAILRRLRAAEFPVSIDEPLRVALEGRTADVWADVQGARERVVAFDAAMQARSGGKHRLYGFQKAGIEWLTQRTCALLADEMGLGKTIQALAALPGSPRVVVVCPAVAKGVWSREAKAWRPQLTVTELAGRGSFRWPAIGEIVVTNYDILPEAHKEGCKGKDAKCEGCAPFLAECPEGVIVIADEAHGLKNSKAQRTIRFRALAEVARSKRGRTWLLTATPLLNRPSELWSVYQAGNLAQEAFGSWKSFLRIFRGSPGRFGGYTWGLAEESAVERMQRVQLRRLRRDVLPDLPGKTRRMVEVTVGAKALKNAEAAFAQAFGTADAEEIVRAIRAGVEDGKSAGFEGLSAARAALSAAKIPALLEHVEEFEENEEPVVVFSSYLAPIDALAGREGWAVITGETSAAERTRIQDEFQAGKLRGVACTIKAGGVAITLTRAAHALFVDQEWTPALNAQAEDRICRIGQTRGCTITVLVAKHPIDERVAELLNEKQEILDASVEQSKTVGDVRFEAPLDLSMFKDPEPEPAPEAPQQRAVIGGSGFRKAVRRPAASPVEEWAAHALLQLSGDDSDRARTINGVGFSKFDGAFGHDLARQVHGGLTDGQWAAAIRLCRKYSRQVGSPPDEKCDGGCEPTCAWCRRQADEAFDNEQL